MQLGLGGLKKTDITLCLADRSVKYPKCVVEDVIVKVKDFYFSVDFVVLETEPMAAPTNIFLSFLVDRSLQHQMQ